MNSSSNKRLFPKSRDMTVAYFYDTILNLSFSMTTAILPDCGGNHPGLCVMLALALISVKIVLQLFLKSCRNYTVICLTSKKGKKLEPSEDDSALLTLYTSFIS